MRVLLLITDLQPGGTPLRIARLARGLRSLGVETIVGSLAAAGPVSADLEAAGIRTIACDARDVYDWQTLQRLARHVRRLRPDLIHATLTHANVAARLVGLMERVPVVTSTATIEVERRWHRAVELVTARMDRGHIVNSRTLAEHVARAFRLSRKHIHVVPPSLAAIPRRIDRTQARRRLGVLPHEFVTLWVGRFDPVKRLDLVIRCAEILNTIPSRFFLAGDGPHRPAVERMVKLSSAARSVHLLGWQEDLGPVMSAADVFLFPSMTEGMPNAVLEAMAFGLPVVGSNIPALRELAGSHSFPMSVESRLTLDVSRPLDSDARLLLVSGDQPKPFADALLQLRSDEEQLTALGNRAKKWARRHLDLEATIHTVLGVYQSICLRGTPSGAG